MIWPACASAEIGRRGISTTDDDAKPLIGSWTIGIAKKGGESGGATRLGDDAQRAPKGRLRLSDRVVADQDNVIDMALGDREDPIANPARR
jgi:hypothetical protein